MNVYFITIDSNISPLLFTHQISIALASCTGGAFSLGGTQEKKGGTQ